MNAQTEIQMAEKAALVAVASSPADPMLAMIERVASNPELPIDRVSALMDMRERQMDKEAEQAFNRAFAAAMGEMPNVPKSGKNKHSGNKYSTLDDLIRTARPVLAREGLSLNWQSGIEKNEVSVTAIVRHALGHSINTGLTGPRDSGKQMNPLQGGGSTETYLKRYTGFSILGLSSGDEVDDDGRGSHASGQTISAEKYVKLRDRLEEAGIAEATICQAHKCESLFEFPAKDFDYAMGNLQTNIANNQKMNDGAQ